MTSIEAGLISGLIAVIVIGVFEVSTDKEAYQLDVTEWRCTSQHGSECVQYSKVNDGN